MRKSKLIVNWYFEGTCILDNLTDEDFKNNFNEIIDQIYANMYLV